MGIATQEGPSIQGEIRKGPETQTTDSQPPDPSQEGREASTLWPKSFNVDCLHVFIAALTTEQLL